VLACLPQRQPLIDDRTFVSWLVRVPTPKESRFARPISALQIHALEETWQARSDAPTVEEERPVVPMQAVYPDAVTYQRILSALVKLEADYDRALKEAQRQDHVAVRWDQGLNRKTLACFVVPKFSYDNDVKLCVGDELRIRYPGELARGWQATGHVIKIANPQSDEIWLELKESFYAAPEDDALDGQHHSLMMETLVSFSKPRRRAHHQFEAPPLHLTSGFSVEFVWKSVSFDRMLRALRLIASDARSVAPDIRHKLLGAVSLPPPASPPSAEDRLSAAFGALALEADPALGSFGAEGTWRAPPVGHQVSDWAALGPSPADAFAKAGAAGKISVDSLAELNASQVHAIKMVLQKPLSLIQGPPGTGKTVTSATLVHHLVHNHGLQSHRGGPAKVLVCAPSNVAVDQLTEKIHQSGLKVVRITAKSRESLDTCISFLTLHELVRHHPSYAELRKLMLLKEEQGELSTADEKKYLALRKKCEKEILNAADVICATCVGAGDPRLAGT
jgi:regulator of nonsense transcripts 1